MPLLTIGDTIPNQSLLTLDAEGHPAPVSLASYLSGQRVVVFGIPGAFTSTCHSKHMPSFVRTADQFRAKGIDEIICVAVNDPFVLHAWAKATDANNAGIRVLSDADCSLTQSIGMEFSLPEAGLLKRSARYALLADDWVVQILHRENMPGQCISSSGEALLSAI